MIISTLSFNINQIWSTSCSFEGEICWFQDYFTQLVHFYVPMAILLVSGIIFYSITTKILFKHQRMLSLEPNVANIDLRVRYAQHF